MSKIKLATFIVLLSALFCLCHSQEPMDYIDVSSSVNSTFEAHYNYTPKVVTVRNEIYSVYVHYSFYGSKLFFTSLNSGNRWQGVKTCDHSVPLDSVIVIEKVVALGNGKIVIVSNHQIDCEKHSVYHIIIDPFDCSGEKMVRVPLIGNQVIKHLIPYYDSYDIFYTYYTTNITGLTKNPHRYNDQGERVQLDYSLETQPEYYHNFQINTIKPFDASEGYYHWYYDLDNDIRNGQFVLQRLNSRFQKIKEIRLNNTKIEVATTQGHINYCSFKNAENSFCKLLNPDLEVQFTRKLPKLNFPKTGYVDERKVINLPKKGLVVFISYKHLDDSGSTILDFARYTYDFYLQRVGSDVSEVKTWKIGSDRLKFKQDYTIVNSNKDFCHVTISTDLYPNVTVYARCLDL